MEESTVENPENLLPHDRTPDKPWHLNDRETEEELRKAALRYPDMDFPFFALKQGLEFKRIFKPRRFDRERKHAFRGRSIAKIN